MRSCSPRAGSIGSGWATRSGADSSRRRCSLKPGRARLPSRYGGGEETGAPADDPETRRRVEAERACVAAIGGGCLAPVAAHHDGTTLTALVAAEDGAWVEPRSGEDALALARELLAVVA